MPRRRIVTTSLERIEYELARLRSEIVIAGRPTSINQRAAAEMLGVAYKTVQRMVARGELRPVSTSESGELDFDPREVARARGDAEDRRRRVRREALAARAADRLSRVRNPPARRARAARDAPRSE